MKKSYDSKGIYYIEKKKLYRAVIYRNNKTIDLGYYKTFEDAKEVRDRNIEFPDKLYTKVDYAIEKLRLI